MVKVASGGQSIIFQGAYRGMIVAVKVDVLLFPPQGHSDYFGMSTFFVIFNIIICIRNFVMLTHRISRSTH